MSEKLAKCRYCGAECGPEEYGNTEAVPVPCMIWICTNARLRGGDCPDKTGYLSAAAWNDAMTNTPEPSADVVEAFWHEANSVVDTDENREVVRKAITFALSTSPAPSQSGLVEALEGQAATLVAVRAMVHDPGNADQIEKICGEQLQANAALVAQCRSTNDQTAPDGPKTAITKEWCEKMAKIEGDSAISAGAPDHPLRALETAPDGLVGELARDLLAASMRHFGSTKAAARDVANNNYGRRRVCIGAALHAVRTALAGRDNTALSVVLKADLQIGDFQRAWDKCDSLPAITFSESEEADLLEALAGDA